LCAGVFPDTKHKTSDDEVEHNVSFHDITIWSSRLWRPEGNYTQMRIQWDQPISLFSQLCAYRLHYYRGDRSTRGRYTINSVWESDNDNRE